MNFGMFTDFHVRGGNTQAESFDESFDQVMAAERLGLPNALTKSSIRVEFTEI